MAEGCVDEVVSLDELVDALRHLEQFSAVVALGTAQLNESGLWAADGALTMKSWLRQHTRLSDRDAGRLVKDGKFLRDYNAVGAAAVAGVLSASQVTALKEMVTKPTGELFAEHQQGVIDSIAGLNAHDTETVCQHWREMAEAIVDMPEPKVRERSWSTSELPDGSVVGRFVLDKLGAEQMETALETGRSSDGAGDERTASVRNADAIVDIFGFFNANHHSPDTPRHYPHVELHLQATPTGSDPLLGGCAVTANGRMLPEWATDMFLCDCVIHRVLRAGSVITDYGRETRSVPKPLWRAVAARDRGCRVPGCGRKKAWCDAHHIRWWRKHGETKLDNLLLLCGRHHQLVHRDGWLIALDADTGRVTFTLPNGTTLISQAPTNPTIRAA
jgi:hypothetical protein